MGKLYWVFIVGFCGLLAYAGATGNFGILPRIDLPFISSQPPKELLASTMLLPDRTGTAGFTIQQMATLLEKNRATLTWEKGTVGNSWVLRYSIPDELTNTTGKGAVRLTVVPNASALEIQGQAVIATGWAEDGEDMGLADMYVTVIGLRSAIREQGI